MKFLRQFIVVMTCVQLYNCIKVPKKVPAIVAIQFVNNTDKNPSISTVYKYTSKRTIESSLGNYENEIPKRFEIYPYSQKDIPPLKNSQTEEIGHIRNEEFNDVFYDHPTASATHLVPVILVRLNTDYMTHNGHEDYEAPEYIPSHKTHNIPQQQHDFNLQSLISNYINRYNLPTLMLMSMHQQPSPILENYPSDTHTKAYIYNNQNYEPQQEYSDQNYGQYMYVLSPVNNGHTDVEQEPNYQHAYPKNQVAKPQYQSVSHSYFYQY